MKREQRTVYIADDNTEFLSADEAEKYERGYKLDKLFDLLSYNCDTDMVKNFIREHWEEITLIFDPYYGQE